MKEKKTNTESEFKEYRTVVCIVGLEYVGLPLAETFSGHVRVIGYDVDEAKVAELSDKDGGREAVKSASESLNVGGPNTGSRMNWAINIGAIVSAYITLSVVSAYIIRAILRRY